MIFFLGSVVLFLVFVLCCCPFINFYYGFRLSCEVCVYILAFSFDLVEFCVCRMVVEYCLFLRFSQLFIVTVIVLLTIGRSIILLFIFSGGVLMKCYLFRPFLF